MRTIFIACYLLSTTLLFSQNAVVKFFPAAAVPDGGRQNVQQLVKGYLSPLEQDVAMAICNGWVSTPVVHKRWGFDFTVSLTTALVSDKMKQFAVSNLNGIALTNSNLVCTVYGDQGEHQTFTFTQGSNTATSFKGPDGGSVINGNGSSVSALAIPTLQAGVGILKDTDLRIRYSPTVSVHGIQYGTSGIAVMHDFRRFVPFFIENTASLSVLAGYSRLNIVADMSGVYTGTGQEAKVATNAFTIQALAGKEFLKTITLFAGVGCNVASGSFDINGTYNVIAGGYGETLASGVTLTDPFSDSRAMTSLRATGGGRLRVGLVTVNSDYTLLNGRRLLTAGFSFTVR